MTSDRPPEAPLASSAHDAADAHSRGHRVSRFAAFSRILGVVVLVSGLSIVHGNTLQAQPSLPDFRATPDRALQTAAKRQVRRTPEILSNNGLPTSVVEMRDLIFEAVRSGQIEDLRTALEWNELRPDLGIDRKTDAIEHFRSASRDGKGLEILATLATLLSAPPTRLKLGRDLENNDIFVWPGLAEADMKALSDRNKVELFRFMPPDVANETLKTGKWQWYRIAIGADGVWHVFKKGP